MSVATGSKSNNGGLPSGGDQQPSDESQVARERTQRVMREMLRKGLIATFTAQQSDVCTHLALSDVASYWAPRRGEATMRQAKEAAFDDLMEAAFEGHIPELIFLDERAGVEHVIGAPWCQDADCPLQGTDREMELSAILDAKWFADWRRFGDLDSKDRYLKSQYGPHCWARREAVVALLVRRGVDRADLPISWSDQPAIGESTTTGVSSANPAFKSTTLTTRVQSSVQKKSVPDGPATRLYESRRETLKNPPTEADDFEWGATVEWEGTVGISHKRIKKLRSKHTNRPRGRPKAVTAVSK
jgi:hypothetical protein